MKYGAARAMRIVCAGHEGPANDVRRMAHLTITPKTMAPDIAGRRRRRALPRAGAAIPPAVLAGVIGKAPYEAVLGQMVTIREGGSRAPRHGGRGISAPARKTRT